MAVYRQQATAQYYRVGTDVACPIQRLDLLFTKASKFDERVGSCCWVRITDSPWNANRGPRLHPGCQAAGRTSRREHRRTRNECKCMVVLMPWRSRAGRYRIAGPLDLPSEGADSTNRGRNTCPGTGLWGSRESYRHLKFTSIYRRALESAHPSACGGPGESLDRRPEGGPA